MTSKFVWWVCENCLAHINRYNCNASRDVLCASQHMERTFFVILFWICIKRRLLWLSHQPTCVGREWRRGESESAAAVIVQPIQVTRKWYVRWKLILNGVYQPWSNPEIIVELRVYIVWVATIGNGNWTFHHFDEMWDEGLVVAKPYNSRTYRFMLNYAIHSGHFPFLSDFSATYRFLLYFKQKQYTKSLKIWTKINNHHNCCRICIEWSGRTFLFVGIKIASRLSGTSSSNGMVRLKVKKTCNQQTTQLKPALWPN